MAKALQISRSGIALIDVPSSLRRDQLLRLVRITAVVFASFVVAQTIILFTLDRLL